jgi:hypothetical protein
MSTQPPRHGAPGCPREAGLTARNGLTAALAADRRDMSGLRARLDGFTVRFGSASELLRSAS